jgi:division/cell wall cluster transcriptional repressor MraZ
MPDNATAKLFLGKFPGKLDDKNRLTIPATWRAMFEDDEPYLAMFYPPTGSILVYPPTSAKKIAEAALNAKQSNVSGFKALRRLGGDSCPVTCDKSGRIILREDILQQANVTKEVRFTGAFSTFEIISTSNPPPPDETSDDARMLLEALEGIGL